MAVQIVEPSWGETKGTSHAAFAPTSPGLCIDAELIMLIQTYPWPSLPHFQRCSHFGSYYDSILYQRVTGGGCYNDLWMIPLEYTNFMIIYVHIRS